MTRFDSGGETGDIAKQASHPSRTSLIGKYPCGVHYHAAGTLSRPLISLQMAPDALEHVDRRDRRDGGGPGHQHAAVAGNVPKASSL